MTVDIHALSGSYAVDAVDELERARFERHLADCASCRSEVESLREAAALIAETSAATPPPSLRDSVLAEIRTVRPLPPVVAAAAERGRSTRRRFPALVAAAAALIVVGGVGATVWHPWSDDDRPVVSEAQSIKDAPDAQTFTGTLNNGGDLSVTRSKSLNQAIVTTDGLAPLDDDLTYQLWLVHDDVMVGAGTMDGDASSVLLDGDARTATGVGITIEEAGGAEEPDLDSLVANLPLEQA